METAEALELLQRRLQLLESALAEATDDAKRRRLRDELLELHRRFDVISGATVTGPLKPLRPEPGAQAPAASLVALSTNGLQESEWASAATLGEAGQSITFLDAAAICLLEKPFDFTGRASRREYWWFAAFVALTNAFVAFVLYPAAESGQLDGPVGFLVQLAGAGLLLWIIIAHLAAAVRRLHDTGRSGYAVLLSLIPLAGLLFMLVVLTERGEPEANEYG